MKPLSLSKVVTKWGAPMGRSNQMPENKNAKGKLQLCRMKMYDGAYDMGGAYWGCGDRDMYHAEGELVDEEFVTIVFVRAFSRANAKLE